MARSLVGGMARTAPSVSPTTLYARRWRALGILALSLVLIGLDNTVVNVALPSIQREFNATAADLQWIVDAYVVVFAGLLLLMGALGDRFGRARALQIGVVLFGLSSLAAAFSTSSGQLIASRVAMGVAGAIIMPATLSLIIAMFPTNERGRAIAVWAGVAGLGVGLGPLVGGLLLERFWWGSVFLISVPVVLIALIGGWLLVPESKDPSKSALDWPGALLSIGAISTLVYALIEAPVRGWTDPFILAAFFVGAALAIGFAYRERTAAHPMLDLSLFRDARFSLGAGAIAFAFFSLFGVIFALTQYLQFVQGLKPLDAGLMFAPLAVGLPMGAQASVRLVKHIGRNRTVGGALVVLSLILASMTQWRPDTSLWVIAITLFVTAFTMANVMAPSTESVMASVPEAKAGVGSAMNDVVRQVAGAFAVAILGSALATIYGDRMAAVVAGLPAEAAGPASDSVGAALAIAAQVGGAAGQALAAAARDAFVGGMAAALAIAAVTAFIGGITVIRRMPAGSTESVR